MSTSSITLSALSAPAVARLKQPRTRGRFAPLDGARRQLALLEVADDLGQAHASWLIELSSGIIADSRFLAFGGLASHPIADVFTETVRGRTVAEAAQITAEQLEALLRSDPLTPAFAEYGLEPFAFVRQLQDRALAAVPTLRVLPKPAEVHAYQRKRKQEWSEADRGWLPLSLLAKISKVDAAASAVLSAVAPAATAIIEGLHDDFHVVMRIAGVAAETQATVHLAVQDRLRATLHPELVVSGDSPLVKSGDSPQIKSGNSPVPVAEIIVPLPSSELVISSTTAISGETAASNGPAGDNYKYGFSTTVEAEHFAAGLDESVVRRLSAGRHEPAFLLADRLKGFALWQAKREPTWAIVDYPAIDYQAIQYHSSPKGKKDGAPTYASLDEVPAEVLATFAKLGIPLDEQKRLSGVAVDAVFDSVSVATTHQGKLYDAGVIFCSFGEAVQHFPALIERWLGSVVPASDNYFAALNAAVFSDGSFVYIPPFTRCPLELSTYFRINNTDAGQFERTLIVCDQGAYVSYLEGCTAPKSSKHQLHAAVVELVALDQAEIKYSTVQNWFAGDADGVGGVYNFVTKRGACRGRDSKISWTQVEAGSAITWKYPSCLLIGDGSVGEFYSVAVTNGRMQADTGTKMIHLGANTRSRIVSKGISAERSRNVYRGLVQVAKKAAGARNHTACDSLLVGTACQAHTYPYVDVQRGDAQVEHEASTSRLSEDQLFYLRARGLSQEDAVAAIVTGFCKDVLDVLPLEFAAEARKLLTMKLENSVG